ncbi:hypothetical protein KHQ82_06630 [Mycoplasmatota bacterium]|nr:hypothetical protein KHQ82_06630 [Mycoplasmatota bacterium]
MKENERRFLIKDIIKLSKLPSVLINNVLKEKETFLSKRLLCYILAQQINIQVSNDKDLSSLRGYVGELEDYTLQQLINFADIHSISIDPSDLKFRIWTVIFNNLDELNIENELIEKYLNNTQYRFEYAKDIFLTLDQFIDEDNDIDGQPFIVARESLLRFSTREEIISLGKHLGIHVPKKLSKDSFIENIIQKLEDDSAELREELSELTLPELEEYADENFLGLNAKLSVKDIINYILNDYQSPTDKATTIEYINYLQIPSLNSGFIEDENRNIEDLRPKNVLDESLLDMISQIIRGEDYSSNDDISEEKSKVELDKVIDKIVQGNVSNKKEDNEDFDVEDKTSDKISSREQELMERLDRLENQLSKPIEPKYKQENSNVILSNELLKKFDELEKKLFSERNSIEVKSDDLENKDDTILLAKIDELEKKLSLLNDEPKIDESKNTDLLKRLNELENKISEVSNNEVDIEEEYDNGDYVYQINEEPNENYEMSYELKPKTESDGLVNKFDPLTTENQIEEEIDISVEDESSIESYIEEIHSAKGKESLKVRRRKTILPIVVFWKALVIWALINAIGATIFIINDLI